MIDNPDITLGELMQHIPGPDFPTGGVICGRTAIQRGYQTGRSTRCGPRAARASRTQARRRGSSSTRFPTSRPAIASRSGSPQLGAEGKIPGISAVHNESDLNEPVRLIVDLKRDADPDVVLNQLYKFSPLQETFSVILLALVDGKPRTLTLKEMLEEYLRHRVSVIRRRTQFLLARARKRKHTVQGLLIAHADIDEVIRVIRSSKTQAEAKERLMEIKAPARHARTGSGRRRLRAVPAANAAWPRTTRLRPCRPTPF